MDEKAFIDWLVFGIIEKFNDANIQQRGRNAPLIDLTIDETSNGPNSSSVDMEEAVGSERDTSTTNILQGSSNGSSDSSSSDEDVDMDENTGRVQSIKRAHLEENLHGKDELQLAEVSRDESISEATLSKVPQARPQKGPKSKQSFEVITYSQLEKKQPSMAKEVLHYYHDPRHPGMVHLCGLFLDGKCDYMKKKSTKVLNHLKRHVESNISAVKVIDYPLPRDRMIHKCVTKSYSDLKKDHPELAKRVLSYYKDGKNRYKCNIHLCALCLVGKWEYIAYDAKNVRRHIACKHPNQEISVVKVVAYPGSKQRNSHDYVVMTYAELRQRQPGLAQQAMDFYYKNKYKCRAHICGLTLSGECDYHASFLDRSVRHHAKKHHSRVNPPVAVYKVIEYPPKHI